MKNVILSLFDFSGNWSRPWRENGFVVFQIDLLLGQDILTWDYKAAIPKDSVFGILAACPCTDFSCAGSLYWNRKDFDGTTDLSVSLVKKTLEIVDYFSPVFWAIENPKGRIQSCVPDIGDPVMYFQPYWYCNYGDGYPWENYSKLTYLYGHFNSNLQRAFLPGTVDRFDKHSLSECYRLYGRSLRFDSQEYKSIKSNTPLGFSYSFFDANKYGVPEQVTFYE